MAEAKQVANFLHGHILQVDCRSPHEQGVDVLVLGTIEVESAKRVGRNGRASPHVSKTKKIDKVEMNQEG